MTRLPLCLIVLLSAQGCIGFRFRKDEIGVNPVGQVITLLEDLVAQTQEEGDAEAKTYEEFSCFCKDTTKKKSDAISSDKDEVDKQAATLEEKDSLRIQLQKEIEDLQNLIAQTSKDMSDAQAQRDADRAKYEAKAADLTAAVTGIEGALNRMEAAEGEVSLSQIKRTMLKSLTIADTLGLSPKHQRALSSFLQEDDDGTPESDFAFHGNELLDTMGDLSKTYAEKKTQCDEEEAAALSAHNDYMAAKTRQKETAESDLDTKTTDLENCMKEIGEANEAMATAKAMLTDDEQYMKDLTAKCELKAKEWDQRSQMRSDELAALSKALGIMQDRVKEKDEQANKRAALVQQSEGPDSADDDEDDSEDADDEQDDNDGADEDEDEDEGEDDDDVSFLQRPRRQVGILLRHAQKNHRRKSLLQVTPKKTKVVKDEEAAREKALELLRTKGTQLKSAVLASVLMKVSVDPFVKVKKLMQELIERLVTEAADEATQKGWCDTELGKAESSRDSEYVHASKANSKVEKLEATRDQLSDDIDNLTKELDELNQSLEDTTKMRAEEKAENMDTITKAGEGLDAVTEAIGILQQFYKQAGKAKVLLQVSPVDEDSPDVHSGAYKGNQAASSGILGMMAVIKSDFERSIKTTQTQEKEAARSFAEFDTATKSSIKAKETSKGMKEGDKSKAVADLTEGMQDLEEHMRLLDDALKQLEDLKPACIDTGMSYEDRVAKREEEIEALKNAMCILDTDGVEGDC